MDPSRPYLEPTQVSLGEKPKAYRVEPVVRELGGLYLLGML